MVANHIGQSLLNTCIFDVHSYIHIQPHTTQIYVSNHCYVQVRYMFLRQRSKMKRKKSRHCGQYFGQPLIIWNRHVSMLFGKRGDTVLEVVGSQVLYKPVRVEWLGWNDAKMVASSFASAPLAPNEWAQLLPSESSSYLSISSWALTLPPHFRNYIQGSS